LNNKDYKVAEKHNHLDTQLHQRNVNITKDFLKLRNKIIKSANEVTDDFLNQKVNIKFHNV